MYKKVIAAVDLSEASEKVVAKALDLVANDASKLSVLHVVEPVPTVWGADPYAIDPLKFQQVLIDNAEAKVGEIVKNVGIETQERYIVLGMAANEIQKLARELSADLVVVGSHGHNGWKLILGSTANKVLHGAICDVLTVRIGED